MKIADLQANTAEIIGCNGRQRSHSGRMGPRPRRRHLYKAAARMPSDLQQKDQHRRHLYTTAAVQKVDTKRRQTGISAQSMMAPGEQLNSGVTTDQLPAASGDPGCCSIQDNGPHQLPSMPGQAAWAGEDIQQLVMYGSCINTPQCWSRLKKERQKEEIYVQANVHYLWGQAWSLMTA